jgi:hypothetical protein
VEVVAVDLVAVASWIVASEAGGQWIWWPWRRGQWRRGGDHVQLAVAVAVATNKKSLADVIG